MCGIAGVVSPDPALRDERVVRSMLAAVRHRGPDDEGLKSLGTATLGARRLSIIDLVAGHQPMLNEEGSVAAVQNGEIYNFVAIREELEAKGHRFRTRNDTEILPHAFEEWGADLVPRLHGMFAIAIWDARTRTLLLARDRFGKKPLMYARSPDALVFGSEIQALLTHPAVARDVDDTAIADYLALGYVPWPRTGFASIRKVPPGHVVIARDGSFDIQRYWTLRYEPKLHIGIEEACAEVRGLVDRAVERRLISDVPLGAFLSGGLDSSTVVAHMARHSDRPVRTFSVRFSDSSYDESRYARIVSRAFATEHEELTVDSIDPDVLPALVRHVGEPFADSSIVPTYQIARVTRPHVTVVLTGDGGDELFAGYDRYRAAAIAAALPGPVGRGLAGLGRLIPDGPGLPRAVQRGRRLLVGLDAGAEGQHAAWTGLFGGPLARLLGGDRVSARSSLPTEQLRRAAEITGAATLPERYMASDIVWYLPDDLLTKMDIATMACSLEARAPLLDHDLHEFVARLPLSFKLSPTTSKVLLRRAMRGIVPDEILDRRRKMGFAAPVGSWLRGPLRDVVREVLLGPSSATRGYVPEDSARRLFEEHLSGQRDRAPQLWGLMTLEMWFREVVHAPAAPPRAALPARIVAAAGRMESTET